MVLVVLGDGGVEGAETSHFVSISEQTAGDSLSLFWPQRQMIQMEIVMTVGGRLVGVAGVMKRNKEEGREYDKTSMEK